MSSIVFETKKIPKTSGRLAASVQSQSDKKYNLEGFSISFSSSALVLAL
jgi:hypothetical protein